MSFTGSRTSFTRLRVIDELTKDTLQNIPAILKQFAFQDIDNLATERSFGWSSFDDMLDTNWEFSVPEKGEYICFALRLDTRRIPPAVLKKHTRIALKQEELKMLEIGKKFVSKERRTEIKEQVKLTLMTRFLPIPAEFSVVWQPDKKMIYFGSTQSKMIDMFTELFVRSFDVHIEPLTPYTLALQVLGEEISQKLDALSPSNFAD